MMTLLRPIDTGPQNLQQPVPHLIYPAQNVLFHVGGIHKESKPPAGFQLESDLERPYPGRAWGESLEIQIVPRTVSVRLFLGHKASLQKGFPLAKSLFWGEGRFHDIRNVRRGSRLDYNRAMEESQHIALTFCLLSGISVLLIGAGLLFRPGWLDSFFRAQGTAEAGPREHKLFCFSLQTAGAAWIFVAGLWLIPFPYARPFWIPILVFILIPLAGLLVAAALAWAFLIRRFAGKSSRR